MKSSEQVSDMFDYHPPTDVTIKKHQIVRETFKYLTNFLDEILPEETNEQRRCKALAFTKLEEAAMWSSKSIAYSSIDN